MKTVYGPVPSWRLGKSLGIDVISVRKICSFDCVYCQLGAKDKMTVRRAKFDAPNAAVLKKINRPHPSLSFKTILDGLKAFGRVYEGAFELQIMVINENARHVEELASRAAELKPDRVELNTPLRRCPVKPLGRAELKAVKDIFEEKGLNTISVYEAGEVEVTSINHKETLRRRPE